jgi:copper(I)-binding protein
MMRAFILLMCLAATAVSAGEKTPTIVVSDAWVRASIGQSSTSAAYLIIENRGTTDDKLISIATPVAAMAHLHESLDANGVMQMRAVPALSIKAGETVVLKPGALHVMMMNLKSPLKAGDTATLMLTFANAGKFSVDAKVKGLNEK